MRQLIIIGLLILISCGDKTVENHIDNLTLEEITKTMTGHWKLKEIKRGKEIIQISETDTIQSFEFKGLKGINDEMIDNHDGSFSSPTTPPTFELRGQKNKKIIEYDALGGSRKLEIIRVTNDTLVLKDSITTWIYSRYKIRSR